MTISISSSALLVDLSISTWTARKLDKAVTSEVNTSKRASASASRVNKNLLPEVKQLDDIIKHAAAARNWVYANSLPWSDYGPRLVPTASFFDFKAKVNEFEQEFWDKVDNFIAQYPTLISMQAFQLGDMFDRDEYPDADQLRSRFAFSVSFTPVPESGDFRLDINTEAVNQLREQYEASYKARLDGAVADIRERLLNGMHHIVDRLGYSEDGKPNVFRNSLVENFVDMLGTVRQLNVTKDEAIDRLVQSAESTIAHVDVDDLRKDEHTRKQVQSQIKDILDAFSI